MPPLNKSDRRTSRMQHASWAASWHRQQVQTDGQSDLSQSGMLAMCVALKKFALLLVGYIIVQA